MIVTNVIESSEIEKLSLPGEEARLAFDRMYPKLRRYIEVILAHRLPNPESREEATLCTLAKVSRYACGRHFESPSRFLGYVRKIARSCSADASSPAGPATSDFDDLDDIPAGDRAHLDVFESLRDEEIRAGADALWLDHAGPERDLRLLAAQLFYVHGASWSDISEMTGQVSRETLERWLDQPGTNNALAYDNLYWGSDRLCAKILACKIGDLDRLTELARTGTSDQCPNGWTWPEVRIVIWTYRNDLKSPEILDFKACEHTEADLNALIRRCGVVARIAERAAWLKERLGHSASAISRSGIWRRLAFEYATVDRLRGNSILERECPAASEFDVPLTAEQLNMWLAGGRIYSQLAHFLERQR